MSEGWKGGRVVLSRRKDRNQEDQEDQEGRGASSPLSLSLSTLWRCRTSAGTGRDDGVMKGAMGGSGRRSWRRRGRLRAATESGHQQRRQTVRKEAIAPISSRQMKHAWRHTGQETGYAFARYPPVEGVLRLPRSTSECEWWCTTGAFTRMR